MNRHTHYHDEVLVALRMIAPPRRGATIRRDCGSQLTHLGIDLPVLWARAVGWVLREAGRTYADEVDAFLEHHAAVPVRSSAARRKNGQG